MNPNHTTKVLRFKNKAKLVAISTKLKREKHIHEVVHLVRYDGIKIHTYDNFIGFDEKNVFKRLTHKVVCYEDFFVLARKTYKLEKGSPAQFREVAIAFSYNGQMLYTTINKWNEKIHYLRAMQELHDLEKDIKR